MGEAQANHITCHIDPLVTTQSTVNINFQHITSLNLNRFPEFLKIFEHVNDITEIDITKKIRNYIEKKIPAK